MPLPITAAEIPPEWIETVRDIQSAGRYEFRGTGLGIEARSPLQNRWHTVMLFGSGYEFVSEADRDSVLQRLQC